MALRKQPDRRVKKKRKLETPKNFDINKRKTRKLEDPENFDIIGSLLCSYGLTGENLARDIFSYMDVSSIEEGRFVCKSWNIFLTNDKKLWMDILRQTLPYLEYLEILPMENFFGRVILISLERMTIIVALKSFNCLRGFKWFKFFFKM